MKYTATEIITIRKSLFLTQKQFAKLINTFQCMIGRWEVGNFRPSPKWTAIIQEKLTEVRRRLEVLNALYREKAESYFVLFESDLVDYAAKQIMYAQKVRAGFECHLVRFNQQSYQDYTHLKCIRTKPLNDWAKWYHQHGEKNADITQFTLSSE